MIRGDCCWLDTAARNKLVGAAIPDSDQDSETESERSRSPHWSTNLTTGAAGKMWGVAHTSVVSPTLRENVDDRDLKWDDIPDDVKPVGRLA